MGAGDCVRRHLRRQQYDHLWFWFVENSDFPPKKKTNQNFDYSSFVCRMSQAADYHRKMSLCRKSIPKHSTKNDWKKTCLFSSKSKQIRMTHLTRLTIICHWTLEEIFRESDSHLAAIIRRHRFIYQQFVGPCFLARMHDHSNLSPISHNFRLFSDQIELFSFPFLSQSD